MCIMALPRQIGVVNIKHVGSLREYPHVPNLFKNEIKNKLVVQLLIRDGFAFLIGRNRLLNENRPSWLIELYFELS